jgi:NADP-dependent 3-hydroxy acid dehydrogenase YdfG
MARRGKRIHALADSMGRTSSGRAVAVPGDVSESPDCKKAVDVAKETFGHLDGLVNAAGAWIEKEFIQVSYDDIQEFVNTDVIGAANISRAVLPELKECGSGRIIHINGLHGFMRSYPPVLYTLVETAVRGLCESLRWEAASYGVCISLLTLGSVANNANPEPSSELLTDSEVRTHLSRNEVAGAVSYILGQPSGVNIDELILTPLGQNFRFV